MINTATQNQATHQPPKLLDQVAAKMRVKYYSIRTEKSYIDLIKRYIWHFDKRPPKMWGGAGRVVFNLFGGGAKCFCQYAKSG